LATAVYEVEEILLQSDDVVELKPLDIKRLRRVLAIVEEMNNVDTSDTDGIEDNLEFLLRAAAVCLEKELPDLAKDNDKMEEALDMPTLWKILEVKAGISMTGPNLRGSAAPPGLV
jgi:hypothetical protein